ncbi:hypothetical protein WME75_46525 [Sorangium sp. So ce1014]|uniref:hypothetical protein n=1 Tax=Sorangium sp. So ce1014 TaxID=3133326 RepID=UPI003F623D0D
MPPLLVLTYVGVVSLGLPDAVLGVAWPLLRTAFALPQSALGALLVGTGSSASIEAWRGGTVVHAAGAERMAGRHAIPTRR